MNWGKIAKPLSILMILVGGFLYIWPLVAGAGAPYPADSPLQIIGISILLVSLCFGGIRGRSD